MWQSEDRIPTAADKAFFKALPPSKATCSYCGRITYAETLNQAHANDRECARRTRDHVVPSSIGGTRLVICCDGCNNTKGDTPEAVFRFFVKENLSLFQNMTGSSSSSIRQRYKKFVYELTLAGFVAAKALARTKKTYGEQLPARTPNGRFTKRDLRAK